MPYDVFISHSQKDKAVANAICAKLEAERIRCWIAPRDIHPGTEWAAAIMGGITSCRAMILIFSSSANASKQVMREVQQACDKGLVVIPFRIEEVKPCDSLGYYIASLHWLDALTGSVEQHIAKLVPRVKVIVGSTTPSVTATLQVPASQRSPPPALKPSAPVSLNSPAKSTKVDTVRISLPSGSASPPEPLDTTYRKPIRLKRPVPPPPEPIQDVKSEPRKPTSFDPVPEPSASAPQATTKSTGGFWASLFSSSPKEAKKKAVNDAQVHSAPLAKPALTAPIAINEDGESHRSAFGYEGVGRNDCCPCGSGKKYKRCCGKVYEGQQESAKPPKRR